MRSALRRVLRSVRDERAYTLVELLTVCAILSIVLGALTSAIVSASNGEADLNRRFQAQNNARLALERIRRETHCASVAAVSASTLTLTLPAQCGAGSGSISWCTSGSSSRYGLYRQAGTTCGASGLKVADYLTTGSVFTYVAQSTSSLAKLHVDFPVNLKGSSPIGKYELIDDIYLRNSSRL